MLIHTENLDLDINLENSGLDLGSRSRLFWDSAKGPSPSTQNEIWSFSMLSNVWFNLTSYIKTQTDVYF